MEVTIKDNSNEVLSAKDKALVRALTAIGLFLEGEAKLELEKNPRRVDTGRLRNSISNAISKEESTVYIGTNVEYAPYVHEGTKKMAPNRFLKNAVINNQKDCIEALKNELQNA